MYGNSTINTDQSDPPNTWDSNFKAVWHLGNGSTLSLNDSTSNGNSLANVGATGATTGKISGGAGPFNGTSQCLKTTSAINLGTNKVTLSAWVNITGYTNSNFAALAQFAVTNWFLDNNSFSSTPDEAGTWGVWAAGNGTRNGGKFTRPSAGVHYVVFTYDTTLGAALNVNAYVDGVAQTITQTFSDNTASANFGNYIVHLMAQSDETVFWPATYLDEVRLSSSIRSADWITAEYNNQNSPGTFITMGSESCATPTPTPTATPAPGLVAAYGFNEGSGTVVNDASGNGNNGTINGATWTTSGKYGNALNFNGTNALVTINNAASLQLTTGMTLEAWVYPTVTGPWWGDVIYKGNDNYYLEGTSNPSGFPAMGGTLPNAPPLYGTGVLALNTWTHLAATYDGATMRLYVNGVQVASRAQTGTIVTSTNPLQIGGDSIYGQYFTGRIDEVRIYNRALSAAQIQSDMNTPL